jgi:hypothetical protein
VEAPIDLSKINELVRQIMERVHPSEEHMKCACGTVLIPTKQVFEQLGIGITEEKSKQKTNRYF